MVEKLKKVYELLEDEISKKIFKNRLLYNVTTEQTYCEKLYEHLLEDQRIANIKKEFCNLINNRKVVIYGIGNRGQRLFRNIKAFMPQVEIAAFCVKKYNEIQEFRGIHVIGVKEFVEEYKDCILLVSPKNHQKEIKDTIVSNGGIEKNILLYESSPILLDVLWIVSCNQYFDDFIEFTKDEIFIDGGCFDGTTSFEFALRCPNYKEIIAFEPNKNNYEMCLKKVAESHLKNITIYNYGLWDSHTLLSFEEGETESKITDGGEITIETETIDTILKEKNVTFIKMDIEGAELKALMGARETIINCRPKLAICIYHKSNDIIEIPLYINSLVSGYKFYIRHYDTCTFETVLYAIPIK